MFKRVLIANRGEIAIRIAKAAADLGVETVAVYPPVDARSLHTRMASEAREIGGHGDPVSAYLDIDALLEVAAETGCDAVHPGYGFLSESATFAQRCAENGIVFVGPPPAALALFGNKVEARALAESLNIPVVPGSHEALGSAEAALAAARDIGFPVMLKASAGGGGRGIRRVDGEDAMEEAFARCAGEAEAAFGDGTLFVEKLIDRPRHIEVQVLADSAGNAIHLFERDCSVQLRNQKVVEIAPAPHLEPGLRDRLLADAISLVKAAGYANAGTVEFLVAPESGEHYFIECNPRIQVEHTITEQVMGVDLVEAQLHVAAGASLADIGLGDQNALGIPRRFALQARVVAQSAGTLAAYKEPSGPGVRVDACGYPGYAPPPQFDPLLAKVVATSSLAGSFVSVVDRAARALEEFHIAGLATNLDQLCTILAHEAVRAGDARTTLLGEHPEILNAPSGNGAARALFEQHAPGGGGQAPAAGQPDPTSTRPSLEPKDGEQAVTCPMTSTVVDVQVEADTVVAAGDTIMVVSAMKMETVVTAPCAGIVTAVQQLAAGDALTAGETVATIAPQEGLARSSNDPEQATWAEVLSEVATLQRLAEERLAPGSEDPGVVRQRSRGKLTCRERIALLLDEGSFREVGSIAGFASYDDYGEIEAFTPANHVGGWGAIEGRTAVVCADDFTSRGGHADGAIGAKSGYLDRLSHRDEDSPSCPACWMGPPAGAAWQPWSRSRKSPSVKAAPRRAPVPSRRAGPAWPVAVALFCRAIWAATMYAEQLTTVPVVNVLLGSVVGIGAAKAVLGSLLLSWCGTSAQLFVAGSAGGFPRHGLRHHQGRPRRLAHPLHQRFGGQRGRNRSRSRGDGAAFSLLPAVQRLRGAAADCPRSGRSANPGGRGTVYADPAQAHDHV